MPHVITTGPDGFDTRHHTRIAVATPDEARDHVHKLGADYGAMAHLDCVLDGTSRMPIGPLPDGTVIEVRLVTAHELAAMVPTTPGAGHTIRALVNAFNSR